MIKLSRQPRSWVLCDDGCCVSTFVHTQGSEQCLAHSRLLEKMCCMNLDDGYKVNAILALHLQLVGAQPPQTLFLACSFPGANSSPTSESLGASWQRQPVLPSLHGLWRAAVSFHERAEYYSVGSRGIPLHLPLSKGEALRHPQWLRWLRRSLSKPVVDVQLNAQHSAVYSVPSYHRLCFTGKNIDVYGEMTCLSSPGL